jgi:hypothetical protein
MNAEGIKKWIINNPLIFGFIILLLVVIIILCIIYIPNNTTISANNTQPTINEKQNIINEINKEGGLLRTLETYNNKLDKTKIISNLHIPNIENYDIIDLKSLIEFKNKLELKNDKELNEGEKKFDKLFIVLAFYFRAEANVNGVPEKNPMSQFQKFIHSNDKKTIINDINKLLKKREIDNNQTNPSEQITNSNIPNIEDYNILELKSLLDLINLVELKNKPDFMKDEEYNMLPMVYMLVLMMYFKMEYNMNGRPIQSMNIFGDSNTKTKTVQEPIEYSNEKKYPDGSSMRYWKITDNKGFVTRYIETINKDKTVTYTSEKEYTDKTIQIPGIPNIDGTILYSWEMPNDDETVTKFSEKVDKIERSVDYTSETVNKNGSVRYTNSTLHY